MKSAAVKSSIRTFGLLFALAGVTPFFAQISRAQEAALLNEEQQFDFVLGDWNVKAKLDGVVIGHNAFTRSTESTAIVERYRQGTVYAGVGLHYYDRAAGKWRQTWTASNGGNGEFIGGLDDGVMRYAGTMRDPQGKVSQVRGFFQPTDRDHFVQTGEVTTDEGKTWTQRYKLYYERAENLDVESDASRAIARVLEIDRILSKQRNAIPETASLSLAVRAYLIGLDGIDFSRCPKDFAMAIRAHRDAWERSIDFLIQHDSLRGEMHKLFDQIRQLGPEQKDQLDTHFREIMDTWKAVEAAYNEASTGAGIAAQASLPGDDSTSDDNSEADSSGDEVYEYATKARLSNEEQTRLVAARRSVWQAWFGGDTEKLQKLVPADSVTGSSDNPQWVLPEKVLEESKAFAASGMKLKSLVFDKNLIQVYGDTAILYVHFHGELSNGEESMPLSGRAVEIFVRRDGQWLNTGWFLQHDQK